MDEYNANQILETVQMQFPDKSIKTIEDKGIWLKHIYKIVFSDNTCVYIKLALRDFSDVLMEENVIDLLLKNGIKQPGVIKADANCSSLPCPYIIQYGGEGNRLSYYLAINDINELDQIYHAIGEYYGKFADIANEWAGVWDVVPEKKKYPFHPSEAMYMLEIEQGSGYKAYSTGAVTPEQYERIKAVWQKNIPMLKEKPVSLVHYSPFPWTIYISNINGDYQVSKITALGDIVWWDADVIAAHILYPPFFTIGDNLRSAFLDGYKKEVDSKSISLYCIMHRLCAWAGVYAEPLSEGNREWRDTCLKDINYFINTSGGI